MEYGLQLYSVRDITKNGLQDAMQKVAGLGYSFVEFAGFFGHSGEEVAGWLKELGLRASGTHTGYNLLALLVEQLSGVPFEEFLQKNIFEAQEAAKVKEEEKTEEKGIELERNL